MACSTLFIKSRQPRPNVKNKAGIKQIVADQRPARFAELYDRCIAGRTPDGWLSKANMATLHRLFSALKDVVFYTQQPRAIDQMAPADR